LSIEQAVKVRRRVIDGNVVDAVLDLASVAVVLTFDACGVFATFGGACFVDTTDGVDVGVLGGDDMLAPVSQFQFIPNDRLEESLQRARSDILIDRNRFGVLPLNA
jgi:hypothetical protein